VSARGWSLSGRVLADLPPQLSVNEAELGRIQQWLTNDMTCDPLGE
jgi:hypothetical protein